MRNLFVLLLVLTFLGVAATAQLPAPATDTVAANRPQLLAASAMDAAERALAEEGRSHRIRGGYDHFPLWSPRGDLILFSRQAEGDYEIYTIKPDGAHIVFSSTRMGFKDEAPYTDSPQPYGEIFVMRADGSDVQQLTDNQ